MNSAKLIHKFRFAIAGLIFLAAGCSVGPNYQKPDLPVPAAWTEAQQKGVDARSAELARWWSTFNDPLLDSLVERAVRRTWICDWPKPAYAKPARRES